MEVFGFVFFSNHVHLLVRAPGGNLPRFMQHLLTNISKKVGHLVRWKGRFWERRYSAEPVLDEVALLGPSALPARPRTEGGIGPELCRVARPQFPIDDARREVPSLPLVQLDPKGQELSIHRGRKPVRRAMGRARDPHAHASAAADAPEPAGMATVPAGRNGGHPSRGGEMPPAFSRAGRRPAPESISPRSAEEAGQPSPVSHQRSRPPEGVPRDVPSLRRGFLAGVASLGAGSARCAVPRRRAPSLHLADCTATRRLTRCKPIGDESARVGLADSWHRLR